MQQAISQIDNPVSIAKAQRIILSNDSFKAVFGRGCDTRAAEELLGGEYLPLSMSGGVCSYTGKDGQKYTVSVQNQGEYQWIELQKARELDDFSYKMSESFILNLSNKLRAPSANAFTLFQNICNKIPGKYYEADKSYFMALNKSLHETLKIINELYLLSVNKKLGEQFRFQYGNISQSLRRIAESAALYAELCRSELLTDIEADPDVMMEFSEPHFEYMVLALLSNALKFNKDNNPVRLCLKRQGDNVLITIEDRGTGIKSDLLPTLFNHMSYDELTAKLDSGIGGGLYLVKSMADFLGGSVTLTSTEGEGTTACISLPICEHADVQGTHSLGQALRPVIGIEDYRIFFSDCLPDEEFGLDS